MADDLHWLAEELSRALSEKADIVELIRFAITRSREGLDAEGVAVLLVDAATNELYFPAAAEKDPERSALARMRFPCERGIAGTVLRTHKSVRIDDVSADARWLAEVDFQTGRRPRALLCVPLIAAQGVIGVMQAVNVFGAAVFTDEDEVLLDAVAGWLADAIERAGREARPEIEVGLAEPRREAPQAAGPQALPTEPRAAESASVSAANSGDTFRKEGEYWTIAFEGRVTRLKDAKGLHYIAYLLRHPGREFHVTELMALVGDSAASPPQSTAQTDQALRVADLGDAGTVLDAKAKADYKRRLDELRSEQEEAERFNDPGRAAQARQEIELINDQLTAAVGLGGRDRVVASAAERARLAVTKRIKAALGKIRQADPALGHHLAAAITTGYFCGYAPKASPGTSWLVE